MLKEGIREKDQHHVVMPATPGTAFEVVEAEFVFEFAVTMFDDPAMILPKEEWG